MKKDIKEEKAFKEIMFRPVPIEREPKRPNRFVLDFPEEFGIQSWIVQTLTRPKLILVDGNYIWEDMKIIFYDIIGESVPNKIYQIVKFLKKENSLFSLIKNKIGLKNEIGFSLYLRDLDPTGVDVGGFKIHVKNITSIDFGKNDYSTGDLLEIELVLQIQDCAVIQ